MSDNYEDYDLPEDVKNEIISHLDNILSVMGPLTAEVTLVIRSYDRENAVDGVVNLTDTVLSNGPFVANAIEALVGAYKKEQASNPDEIIPSQITLN